MSLKRIYKFLKPSINQCLVQNFSSKGQPTRNPLLGRVKDTLIKGVHEPEYLDFLKPHIPFYDLVNVQIKGHDHAVLDQYIKYIKKLTKKFGIQVNRCWATPFESIKLETLQPNSAAVQSTYELNMYERNVQVKHMSAKQAPIYIEAVQSAKPPGVFLNVHEHMPEHDEIRYIPDLQLAQAEKELEEWRQPMNFLQQTNKI